MASNKSLLIQIFAQDTPGLVSAISSCLFELGLSLGDTTFAVLGTGAEFTVVVEEPVPVTVGEIDQRLRELPELEGAEIQVEEFEIEPTHSPQAQITHRIVIRGQDQPGLVARLTEVFQDYGANIVRLNAEREVDARGSTYVLRIAAWMPESRADACIAAVTNTASQLQLFSQWYRA
ncbi:MAG: amino acid-binding protein [Proteobacteria bacterium SW_6_67_9]|jgi:glycine cleavage system transcriptional repressor|nr:MAG: amino acid-binding protein [Proteobacteria bacterium SW_6_67_9]